MATESRVFADLHADIYVTTTWQGRSGRVSVMIDVKPVPSDAPWWVRTPDLAIDFFAGDWLGDVRVSADNGLARTREAGQRSAALFTHVPHDALGRITLGPLPNGTRAYVEISFTTASLDDVPPFLASLQVVQSFGRRRIAGADSMRAEFALVKALEGGEAVVRIEGPRFTVTCDWAEDGAPEVIEEAPDEIDMYDVEMVSGAEGPCPHAWCRDAISDAQPA